MNKPKERKLREDLAKDDFNRKRLIAHAVSEDLDLQENLKCSRTSSKLGCLAPPKFTKTPQTLNEWHSGIFRNTNSTWLNDAWKVAAFYLIEAVCHAPEDVSSLQTALTNMYLEADVDPEIIRNGLDSTSVMLLAKCIKELGDVVEQKYREHVCKKQGLEKEAGYFHTRKLNFAIYKLSAVQVVHYYTSKNWRGKQVVISIDGEGTKKDFASQNVLTTIQRNLNDFSRDLPCRKKLDRAFTDKFVVKLYEYVINGKEIPLTWTEISKAGLDRALIEYTDLCASTRRGEQILNDFGCYSQLEFSPLQARRAKKKIKKVGRSNDKNGVNSSLEGLEGNYGFGSENPKEDSNIGSSNKDKGTIDKEEVGDARKREELENECNDAFPSPRKKQKRFDVGSKFRINFQHDFPEIYESCSKSGWDPNSDAVTKAVERTASEVTVEKEKAIKLVKLCAEMFMHFIDRSHAIHDSEEDIENEDEDSKKLVDTSEEESQEEDEEEG